MRPLLLLLLLSPYVLSQAQTSWFEPGAHWYYFYSSIWQGGGYELLSYESDSLLQGKVCNGLKRDVYYVGTFSMDTVHLDLGYAWVYQSEDTIWEYDPFTETFLPLYQLGANIGDTLTYFQGFGWENSVVVVEDTGSLATNGLSLRTQTLGVYVAGNPGPVLELQVAEKIGFLTYPFGFFWHESAPGLIDVPERAVLCYREADFSELILGNQPCEEWYVSTSLESPASQPQITAFPNPMTQSVSISSLAPIPSLQVFTPTGQLIYEAKHLLTGDLIDVSNWESGWYLFHFQGAGGFSRQPMLKLTSP